MTFPWEMFVGVLLGWWIAVAPELIERATRPRRRRRVEEDELARYR